MGKFDDLFNESDEDWFKRSKKKIASIPKTKDTRTPAQIEQYKRADAKSKEWAKSRKEHEERSMNERIQNMSEEDKAFWRNRASQRSGVSKPHK